MNQKWLRRKNKCGRRLKGDTPRGWPQCAESWAQPRCKRPFPAEMDVSWPRFFVFHAVSRLGDILQSHPVHCSPRCWSVRHSTCLRGVQTLQQVGAQRVKRVAPCPGVHSCLPSPRHLCLCARPREIGSPVCVPMARPSLLQIPYNLWLCHIYAGHGILIKRSQAVFAICSHLRGGLVNHIQEEQEPTARRLEKRGPL